MLLCVRNSSLPNAAKKAVPPPPVVGYCNANRPIQGELPFVCLWQLRVARLCRTPPRIRGSNPCACTHLSGTFLFLPLPPLPSHVASRGDRKVGRAVSCAGAVADVNEDGGLYSALKQTCGTACFNGFSFWFSTLLWDSCCVVSPALSFSLSSL